MQELDHNLFCGLVGPLIRGTFPCIMSRNNVAQQIFMLQKVETASTSSVQRENLLRSEVVIRATNNRNLQLQHCCATSCKKMLPVLLGLYAQL